ncbi:MAG: Asp-tRNA(Asn)/Glu-tRNA(Gln) amidotransferase subunit GatA [Clostridia bacterium]|nr:Asp-tRNA(Asn)/Glu-tRNA(Gln) amidotransferase subunit GatA [Clostridia bacterium]
MEIEKLSVKEILELLDSNKVTSVDLVNAYFDRIDKYEDNIGAFVTLTKDYALDRAKKADEERKNGNKKALLGVPIAIKDNISTKGIKTTCSSKMLEDYTPVYNATVIDKLEEAGAVIIGKTNMDEFAMGGSTETSYFKKTKNPWNTSRVPGGSSGGSIAAVSAGFAPCALGSDTGGSVRQPASYCGVVGLKPTYGMVSRYGLVAFASSLDQIGPTARTVEDCAILLNVIAGHDEHDTTSEQKEYDDFTKTIGVDVKGMKVALPKEFLGEGINEEVKEKVLNCANILKEKGAIVEEISLPASKDAIAVYYILACAEASSNLARYDGIRFGYKSRNYDDLVSMYESARSEGFGWEVKRRIMLGTYVLSSGYYDAYYKKAQQVRTLIAEEYNKVFEKYDIILMPTAPTVAFSFGANDGDPLQMYLNDVCTVPVNVAGLPAMSINCGFDKDHMPIGCQLLAKRFNEKEIFRAGSMLEKELNITEVASLEVK